MEPTETDLPNLPDAEETARTLRAKATAAADTAQVYVTDTLSRGEQYVRDRPWPTVGGAFFLGLVLGALLFHRRPEPSVVERSSGRLEEALASVMEKLLRKKQLQSLIPEIPTSTFFDSLTKKIRSW